MVDAKGAVTNKIRNTTAQNTDGNNVKMPVTRTPDDAEKIMYAAAIKLYAAYVEDIIAMRVHAFWIFRALLSPALKAKVHGQPG